MAVPRGQKKSIKKGNGLLSFENDYKTTYIFY